MIETIVNKLKGNNMNKARASSINWDAINHFDPSEFPKGSLDHMNKSIIFSLVKGRNALPPSHSFYPSPVYGAHVRTSGNSRHSIQGGSRLSDATDFFVEWKHAWAALEQLRRVPEIGGLGIYTDMMFKGVEGDYCMFHIDNRPERIEWASWREDRNHKNKYVYLIEDPLEYHRILAGRGKLS